MARRKSAESSARVSAEATQSHQAALATPATPVGSAPRDAAASGAADASEPSGLAVSPGAPAASAVLAPRRAKLTLNGVALAMGVSRATVSNAFNRPDQLSATRREEVLAKARELGYFGPDPAARALRKQTLREVAVVFHHGLGFALEDALSLDFLRGVGHALDARGLSLQLIPKLGRNLMLSAAFQTTADALIVHAEIGPELVPEVQAARKPLVLVDTQVAGVPDVRIADRQGADQAMSYALAPQPDRVVVVAFTLNPRQRASAFAVREPAPTASVALERAAGYVRAARRAGWKPAQLDWVEVDDGHPESASQALAVLRERIPVGSRVALVAMTDRMALGALDTLRQWPGIKVVAAVGFDDIPAAAAAGLTTLRQDARRKGELAVQVVLDGLPSQLLDVALIRRQT